MEKQRHPVISTMPDNTGIGYFFGEFCLPAYPLIFFELLVALQHSNGAISKIAVPDGIFRLFMNLFRHVDQVEQSVNVAGAQAVFLAELL